jgi:hypothetical protein
LQRVPIARPSSRSPRSRTLLDRYAEALRACGDVLGGDFAGFDEAIARRDAFIGSLNR